jgi:type I restriction enzyme M protein
VARNRPTSDILYCVPEIPADYSLSKTKPLLYEWLLPLKEVISTRQATDQSWLVSVNALDDNLNLDIKTRQ